MQVRRAQLALAGLCGEPTASSCRKPQLDRASCTGLRGMFVQASEAVCLLLHKPVQAISGPPLLKSSCCLPCVWSTRHHAWQVCGRACVLPSRSSATLQRMTLASAGSCPSGMEGSV